MFDWAEYTVRALSARSHAALGIQGREADDDGSLRGLVVGLDIDGTKVDGTRLRDDIFA